MNVLLFHAAELFGEAVEALVGGKTLRDRLLVAARLLYGVAPDEFDRFPDLKDAYADIEAQMSRASDERIGDYAATIETMSGPAKAKLARNIIDIDRMIRNTK